MELSVNSLLQGGKYRIVRYISSGGFGCTYEAEHVLLGKRVAIKEFFVKDFCNRDEHTCQVTVGTESKKGLVEKLRKKFIDEARALSALHHPGIVSVSDVFEENGTAYYVMDYIDGSSLSDLVRCEGPLSESRVLGYIRQVCAALSYVHAHGRLHLDIKPGNIMIDQDGNAILIDFGASKQYDECDGENTSTLMGRTPGYAPLEQLGYDVVKFLPATDIYAVGATLYKLLTGVTPLSATRLASGESLPPLPTQVSASTRKAVESAMCLNKMQRPQSVEAFLQLLEDSEKRNSNDVAEDEGTVFDASIKEPVVKPKKVHSTENDSVSGNKFSRKWLVPIVACLLVCLCVYVFGGRKSGSSGTPDIVWSDTSSVDSIAVDTVAFEENPSKTEVSSSVSSESSLCSFSVTTYPSGAQVMIDDKSYGKTPLSDVKVPVGNRMVSFKLSGYETFSRKIYFGDRPVVLNERLTDNKEVLSSDTSSSASASTNNRETSSNDEETIYITVDEQPQFPGGERARIKWLAENVEYPTICVEHGIQGRVIATFVVNKDGSIVDIEIVNSPDPNLSKETERVLKKMPPWKPGRKDGKPVRVKYSLPLTFRLS